MWRMLRGNPPYRDPLGFTCQEWCGYDCDASAADDYYAYDDYTDMDWNYLSGSCTKCCSTTFGAGFDPSPSPDLEFDMDPEWTSQTSSPTSSSI